MNFGSLFHRLAPDNLPNLHPERYHGTGQDMHMANFHPDDRAGVRLVYRRLNALSRLWRTRSDHPPWAEIAALTRDLQDDEFVQSAYTLCAETWKTTDDLHLQRVMHDVRGGGLTAALVNAEMANDFPDDRELLHSVVLTALDHAKMMRNAIIDIDDEERGEDTEPREHSVVGLVRKWDGRHYHAGKACANITATSDFSGSLASRCLEVSAVDRILYNLVNNATRFTTNQTATIRILQMSASLVRVVVSNPISADQEQWLVDTLRGDSGALFRAGITRGGQGLGLANAAVLVAAAFGLDGSTAAVDDQYVGSKTIDRVYHGWFHWPVYVGPTSG